ncbi:MAG: hypothetical protein V8S54_04355 [Lachnospiraceae bacterium]
MKKTGIAILLAALLFGQTAAAAVYEGQVQETEIQTEAYEEAQAPAEDRETELILPGGTDEEQEMEKKEAGKRRRRRQKRIRHQRLNRLTILF